MKKAFWFLLFTALGCARIVAPDGGPKDTEGPELDSLFSSRQNQLRFQKQDLRFTFKEWIKPVDASRITINPPLAKKPRIKLDRKTVIFQWHEEEVLRENTTYVIDFGESIQDLREGNPTRFQYIFSTGDQIDTLSITGQVRKAFSGEAAEEVSIFFYDNLSDTAFSKARPFSIIKSDKTGLWKANNLKPGAYQLLAVKDANKNNKYDIGTEEAGFLSEPLQLPADTASQPPVLSIGPGQKPFQILSKDLNLWQTVRVGFTGPSDQVKTEWPNSITDVMRENLRDTLLIYYKGTQPWNLTLQLPGGKSDTLQVRPPLSAPALAPLQIVQPKAGTLITPNPAYPLPLEFNTPVVLTNPARILWLKDSVPATSPALVRDSITYSKWRLPIAQNKEATQLIILPGAFTDYFGKELKDTLRYNVKTLEAKSLGNYNIMLNNLNPELYYLLQVFQGTAFISSQRITQKQSYSFTLKSIPLGQYNLRITIDNNNNGKWDGPAPERKILPEKTSLQKLPDLKANWDVEALFDLKQIPDFQ
jgi:uncharacterized protein (DUF2141 family)